MLTMKILCFFGIHKWSLYHSDVWGKYFRCMNCPKDKIMNKSSDKFTIIIVAVIMLFIAVFIIISEFSKVFAGENHHKYEANLENGAYSCQQTITLSLSPTITAGASATPVISIIEETRPTGEVTPTSIPGTPGTGSTVTPTVASAITPIPTITGVQFTLTPTMSTAPTLAIAIPQGAPVASLRER